MEEEEEVTVAMMPTDKAAIAAALRHRRRGRRPRPQIRGFDFVCNRRRVAVILRRELRN